MRIQVFGREDLYIHVGAVKAQTVPDATRVGEEPSRFWNIWRVSLHSEKGGEINKGVAVGVPCADPTPAKPVATEVVKDDKEAQDAPKEETKDQSEDKASDAE